MWKNPLAFEWELIENTESGRAMREIFLGLKARQAVVLIRLAC